MEKGGSIHLCFAIFLPQAISRLPPTSKCSRQTVTAHTLLRCLLASISVNFRICLKMLPPVQFLNVNISPSVQSSHQHQKDKFILMPFLALIFQNSLFPLFEPSFLHLCGTFLALMPHTRCTHEPTHTSLSHSPGHPHTPSHTLIEEGLQYEHVNVLAVVHVTERSGSAQS